MTHTINKDDRQSDVRYQAVQELLHHPTRTAPQRAADAVAARSIAVLERQAPELVRAARAAGVEVEYLGIAELFSETRLYAGADNDWVLGPVTRPDQAVVPAQERHQLECLAAAGINLPLIYIAEEVAKEKTVQLAAPTPGKYGVLDRQTGAELVGPTPEPQDSVALAGRLAQASQQVLNGVARAGRAVGVTAASIVMAPVAALGSVATLDPIILGAIPACSAQAGEPAGWFMLAQWDW
jgi:hypothetical protein